MAGLPSLRAVTIFRALAHALGRSSNGAFRVLHFSVQTDHVHLIAEADSSFALVRGLQGLAIRCARAVNRAADRRGRVWRHRHHRRALRTPSEVRTAIAYVLLNFRKHLRAPRGIDPRSSGQWFGGWRGAATAAPAPRLVAAPRTWLAATGWRRGGGPIDPREVPRRS
jgi:REP element-mobilizing transposase RayT